MAFTTLDYSPIPTTVGQAPPQAYQKRYDYDGSGNLIYVGWSQSGFASSTANWAIKKITQGANGPTLEQWAGGVTDMINIWDDRATLTYS